MIGTKILKGEKVVDYICARCARGGARSIMVESAPDPDIGRMMRCPACGWRSRRPIEVDDKGKVIA